MANVISLPRAGKRLTSGDDWWICHAPMMLFKAKQERKKKALLEMAERLLLTYNPTK